MRKGFCCKLKLHRKKIVEQNRELSSTCAAASYFAIFYFHTYEGINKRWTMPFFKEKKKSHPDHKQIQENCSLPITSRAQMSSDAKGNGSVWRVLHVDLMLILSHSIWDRRQIMELLHRQLLFAIVAIIISLWNENKKKYEL